MGRLDPTTDDTPAQTTTSILLHFAFLLTLFLHTLLPDASLLPSTHHLSPHGSRRKYAISFNVILTTMGRDLIARQLNSLGPQLTEHDFITVLSDIDARQASQWDLIQKTNATVQAIDCNGCTKLFIQNPVPLGGFGHASRTYHQKHLPGDFHLHGDDDDMYTPDAFEIIRAVVTTLYPRVYVFRVAQMNFYPKAKAGKQHQLVAYPLLGNNHPTSVQLFNGGTPCGVVRNLPELLPIWRPTIGGDGVFWEDVIHVMGLDDTVMVPRVIYTIKEDLYPILHELGIDQPRGYWHTDEEGRPLPDGDLALNVVYMNNVPISPNPLLTLPDRSAWLLGGVKEGEGEGGGEGGKGEEGGDEGR